MKKLYVKGTQGAGGPFEVSLSKSEAQQILAAKVDDQIKLSSGSGTLSIHENAILRSQSRSPESMYNKIDAKLDAQGSDTQELDKTHFIDEIRAKFGL